MVQNFVRRGSEFVVNGTTAGDQYSPSVTKLAGGGFVVVWTDASGLTDGDGLAVIAQLFDSAGHPVGSEFVVNSTSAGNQGSPKVAALTSGGFTVAWVSTTTFNMPPSTKAQIFDSQGGKVGGELSLVLGTGNNGPSDIDGLPNGGFVLATSDGRVQQFDSSGSEVGSEHLLASDSFRRGKPSVTALEGGGYAAAIELDSGRIVQLFGPDGSLVGGPIELQNGSWISGPFIAVESLPGGGFVTVFVESGGIVRAQIFDGAGVPITEQILVNRGSRAQSGFDAADVVVLEDGSFLVTWGTETVSGLTQSVVRAQLLDASGAYVGAEFLVSVETDHPNLNHDRPVLAALDSGGFLAVWDGAGPGDPRSPEPNPYPADGGIRAQFFDPIAQPALDLSPGTVAVSEFGIEEVGVAKLRTASESVNGTFTYTLLQDSTGGAFRIEGDRLVIADSRLLDFEAGPSAQVVVRSTDHAGNSVDEMIAIQIEDSATQLRYAAGPEERVDPAVNSFPSHAFVAALPGGGMAVAWTNNHHSADGTGTAVIVQLFDAAGEKVGSFFRANTTISATQEDPTVTALSSGNFVVAWRNDSGTFGDNAGIRAQIFDSTGQKVGHELAVNDRKSTFSPEVAPLPGGGFVITWTDGGQTGADTSVRLQVFDSSGARVGSEQLVHPAEGGPHEDPDIAALADGRFIISWTDKSGDGDLSAVKAQLFDAAGAKLGEPFLVNTSTVRDQQDSSVAALSDGSFIVVWSDSSRLGGDSSSMSIKGQRIDASGARLGDEFLINTTTFSLQNQPNVSAHAKGFVVSWTDYARTGIDDSGAGVRGQLFDLAGNRIGAEFQINDVAVGEQTTSHLAGLTSGGIAAVWLQDYTSAVKLRLISPVVALIGGSGDDQLTGTPGPDEMDGREGADTMSGFGGDDTYHVDDVGDVVIEQAGEGVDTVISTVDHTLAAEVENLTLAGAAVRGTGNVLNNVLTGNDLDNVLDGGIGHDTLYGGFGSDTLLGGAQGDLLDGGGGADAMGGGTGDDVYVVDHADDTVVELAGQGKDHVHASVSYALSANVENLTLTGIGKIDATGNALANQLFGNDKSNRLDGGAGADLMTGGLGDDTYVVDQLGDKTIELAGEGRDTVMASLSWTLGANLENLVLTGTAAIHGTGNELANAITGNDAANVLDGKAGSDTMTGGGGDDTYIVDHAGDRAVELAGGGIDTVVSSVTFALGVHVENLTLTGFLKANAIGNDLANVLTGNDKANRLDGKAGADTMIGGGGDDTYFVDHAGDRAIETDPAGGRDIVRSSVSFAIGDNIEQLVLTGSDAIDGTGNAGANQLYGNAAANRLDGGAGADRMNGGGGDDTYVVDDAGDRVVEIAGQGTDTVLASISFTLAANVEQLVLTGSAASDGTGNRDDNVLTGNVGDNVLRGLDGDDVLDGLAGADTLAGGKGDDVLAGGAGADRFVFDTWLGAAGLDTILDFASGEDRIVLEDKFFGGLSAGALDPARLAIGSAATTADHRIVYDPTTGALFYDADGSGAGAAIQFATLANQPATLSASDFLVI